jgi:O-methyltransferase involved in polyketide biosynthesis
MIEDYIHNKISPLAKCVAYLRTFSDVPFSREIAHSSDAKKAFLETFGNDTKLLSRAAPLVEARYKAVDYLLMQHSVRNILEIASGLSPRGLAFTQDSRVQFVEADLGDIIQQKEIMARNIIRDSGVQHVNNLHFITANALNKEELMNALGSFEIAKKMAVVHDGFLPYLTRDEKSRFASYVRTILSIHGGLWIHADVSMKTRYKEVLKEQGVLKSAMHTISVLIDRDMETNAFEDEEDATTFFKGCGFRVERIPLSSIVGELSSAKKLRVSDDEVRNLLSMSYAWVLQPK